MTVYERAIGIADSVSKGQQDTKVCSCSTCLKRPKSFNSFKNKADPTSINNIQRHSTLGCLKRVNVFVHNCVYAHMLNPFSRLLQYSLLTCLVIWSEQAFGLDFYDTPL